MVNGLVCLTFNEARRLDNIVADVSEDVVYVFLGFDEDLKRRVDIVQLASVCVHQRFVISRYHRCAARQVVQICGHVARCGIVQFLIKV